MNEKNVGSEGVELSDDDKAIDEAAEILVEAVVETLVEECMHEVEPFEHYVNRVRLSLFKEVKDYSDRLIQGHLSLLKELNKEEE